MGLIRGTVTASKYRVIGSMPDNYKDFIDGQIKLFAFRDLSIGEKEKSVGWTSLENILDTNFEYANYLIGNYIIFSLRIDRKVISPALLRLKVLEAEKELMDQRENGRIYREERKDIRDNIHIPLLRQTPPVPSFHEVCWNVSGGWLLFSSLSEKVQEDFEDLFKDTFKLTLRPFFPWDTEYIDSQMKESILSVNST